MKILKIILLLVTLSLGACAISTPRLTPPADAKDMAVLKVKNRSIFSGSLLKGEFKLGSYKVQDIDISATYTEKSETGILFGKASEEKQESSFTFRLVSGQQFIDAKCDTKLYDKEEKLFDIFIRENNFYQYLTCYCGDEAQMIVGSGSKTDHRLNGEITLGEKKYTVAPLNKKIGIAHMLEGFAIKSDKPVAYVETLHPGQVWLSKALSEDEQFVLACPLVALMVEYR